MSETMNPTSEMAPARGALDQDWRKVVNWGLILALALIFVSLTDMPEKLDKRIIVEPLLSMGYLSLVWIPIALGNIVTREVVLEGMTQHKKGARELVAGLVVGAIGGLGLALLIWLLDTRDLSDPCLLYTSPSPRDGLLSRMPSSA